MEISEVERHPYFQLTVAYRTDRITQVEWTRPPGLNLEPFDYKSLY